MKALSEAQTDPTPAKLAAGKLAALGYSFGAGVPCSMLSGYIDALSSTQDIDYIPSMNEAHALAITAGAAINGTRTYLFLQNSGFFNLLDPLTSLSLTFDIPVLLIISWRGEKGTADAVHHDVAGQGFVDILRLLEIPFEKLPSGRDSALACLDRAARTIEQTGRPYAVLVGADSFGAGPPPGPDRHDDAFAQAEDWPSRSAAIATLLSGREKTDIYFSTTGFISRDLFRLHDCDANVYVVGSMGLVSSMALGCALRNPVRAVVLDGDGSALMHLGAMSTIGQACTGSLLHIILDNQAHESTGGQPTGSTNIAFSQLADAVGYRFSRRAETLEAFEDALSACKGMQGPALIHVKIRREPGRQLPRPAISPAQNVERAAEFLKHLTTP